MIVRLKVAVNDKTGSMLRLEVLAVNDKSGGVYEKTRGGSQ